MDAVKVYHPETKRWVDMSLAELFGETENSAGIMQQLRTVAGVQGDRDAVIWVDWAKSRRRIR